MGAGHVGALEQPLHRATGRAADFVDVGDFGALELVRHASPRLSCFGCARVTVENSLMADIDETQAHLRLRCTLALAHRSRLQTKKPASCERGVFCYNVGHI